MPTSADFGGWVISTIAGWFVVTADKIVANWIRYHEQMKEVLNLYFAVIFGAHLFVEHKFLFLAQALEGYHRIRYGTRSQLSKRLVEIIRTQRYPFHIHSRSFTVPATGERWPQSTCASR